MKENPVKWFGYLFSFAFLIISCAGTELTQKQVAESIGINQKQYQHWERGRAEPSFDKIQRLAYIHGVGIEWLLYGKGNLIQHGDATASFVRKIELFLKNNPKALTMMQKMFELFMSSYKNATEKHKKR